MTRRGARSGIGKRARSSTASPPIYPQPLINEATPSVKNAVNYYSHNRFLRFRRTMHQQRSVGTSKARLKSTALPKNTTNNLIKRLFLTGNRHRLMNTCTIQLRGTAGVDIACRTVAYRCQKFGPLPVSLSFCCACYHLCFY